MASSPEPEDVTPSIDEVALRRIAVEALRGMSDNDLLDLRNRLERGDEDDGCEGEADRSGASGCD